MPFTTRDRTRAPRWSHRESFARPARRRPTICASRFRKTPMHTARKIVRRAGSQNGGDTDSR